MDVDTEPEPLGQDLSQHCLLETILPHMQPLTPQVRTCGGGERDGANDPTGTLGAVAQRRSSLTIAFDASFVT